MPKRGDIVIVTPPGRSDDYIKRVIGLPGDTVEVRDGRLILNGKPVRAEVAAARLIPVDANVPCGLEHVRRSASGAATDGRNLPACRSCARRCQNGVTYDTIDLGAISPGDNYGPITVPPDHVFLMGDNRDHSADSRFPLAELGLGGPVPWENIGGRAEFITFSLDGTTEWLTRSPGSKRSARAAPDSSLRAHKD